MADDIDWVAADSGVNTYPFDRANDHMDADGIAGVASDFDTVPAHPSHVHDHAVCAVHHVTTMTGTCPNPFDLPWLRCHRPGCVGTAITFKQIQIQTLE